MPYISEEDFKKFKELMKERKQKRKQEEDSQEEYLTNLIGKFEQFKVDYVNYGTVEAMALKFSTYLKDYFNKTHEEFIPFNWLAMQKYLTDRVLTKNDKGQIDFRRSFRNNLRDYGFTITINRKYNTMRVSKCEPRKRIKR